MEQGDVFQTILKDGRYGAVKVLKTGGTFDFSPDQFHLIGVTSYIDNVPPTLMDKRVNEILICDRLNPEGSFLIKIYSGNFPKECKFIGNYPITETEQKLEIKIGDGINGGFPLSGKIPKEIGYEILREWRYKYDTDNYLKEIEVAQRQHEELMKSQRSSTPKKMLDDKVFWEIIGALDWNEEGDDEKVLLPAVTKLSKLKVSEIKQFEETLSFKLFQLDTKEHAKNIGESSFDEKENYISVDAFLYARCAAVANGENFYNNVLNHPAEMPKDIEFEALLSLASTAYEFKTENEFDYYPGVSYETYSNEKGWT